MKASRYVSDAHLVLQFESVAEERIVSIALSKNGLGKILQLSKSKASRASFDKPLFDVS